MLQVFTTFYGKKKLIDDQNAVRRVSAYTVVVSDKKLLLIKNKNNGKWWFPGGVLEDSESPEAAARREVKEETGILVEIQDRLAEVESYFYYDHADAAYHQFSSFYYAQPLSDALTTEHNSDDSDEAVNPTWVALDLLKEEDFQDYGWEIIKLIK